MQKMPQSQYAVIPSVSLHLDDIQEIIGLFSKAETRVCLKDMEYSYDSLEELIGKCGNHPRVLHIESCPEDWSKPHAYVSLHFDRSSFPIATRLSSNANDASCLLFYKIRDLLEKRKRWFVPFFRPDIAFVAYLGILICQIGFGLGLVPVIYIASFVLAAITYITLQQMVSRGVLFSIDLRKQHEVSTFWRRNSDSIWLLAVGGVLGWVLEVLRRWLVGTE